MRHAKYELFTDDNSYYGEIPECKGVYANTFNLEDCRKELQEVLEDWILIRINKNLSLPIPNPHRSDIGKELLSRILKQAGISRKKWESL